MLRLIADWSDGALVRRAQAGRRDAFEALAVRYLPLVYGVALAHTGNPVDADDVTQDAFVKALSQLPKLREPRRFSVWIGTIARRCAMDVHRSRQRVASEAPPEETHTPDPAQAEVYALLREKLEGLDGDHREVLLLHYYSGFKVRDVAHHLNITTEAAKKRLQRARAALGEEVMRAVAPDGDAWKGRRALVLAALAKAPLGDGGEGVAATAAGVPLLAKAVGVFTAAVMLGGALLLYANPALNPWGYAAVAGSAAPTAVAAVAPEEFTSRDDRSGLAAGGDGEVPPGTPSPPTASPRETAVAAETASDSTQLHIAGRVVDVDGNPVVGAGIGIESDFYQSLPPLADNGRLTYSATDADGAFRFDVPVHGEYEIEVSSQVIGSRHPRQGRLTHTVVVEPGQSIDDLELRFEHSVGPVITGRLLTYDGHAAPDQYVRAVYPDADPGGDNYAPGAQMTDENGRFSILGIPPGVLVTIEANTVLYGRTSLKDIPGDTRDVELRYPEPLTVSGVVLAPNGDPVPHFTLSPHSPRHGSGTVPAEFTDPEGRFTLPGVMKGEVFAFAEGYAYGSVKVTGAPGEHVEGVAIRLEPGARIMGHVRDEAGNPWPGARVYTGDVAFGNREAESARSATADGEGYYELGGVPRERIEVIAEAANTPRVVIHQVRMDEADERRVDFVLQAGAILRGTVRYDESLGPPRVTITNGPKRERVMFSGWTLTEFTAGSSGVSQYIVPEGGAFRVDRLPPGTYYISTQQGGRTNKVEREHQITLAAGETRDVLLDLLDSGTARVTGTIRHDGAPAMEGEVLLVCDAEGGRRDMQVGADGSGAFTIENVPAGEAVAFVGCRGEDGAWLETAYPFTVVEGETVEVNADTALTGKVVVVPTEGRRLTVVAAYYEGVPLNMAVLNDRRPIGYAANGREQDDGRFIIHCLLPGRYTIVGGLHASDRSTAVVDIRAGDEITLDF